jgi:hypothetical protein
LERAPRIFDEPRAEKAKRRAEDAAMAEKDRLLRTIGQLTVERDFLQAIQAKTVENGRLL